jgi:DNA-binding GntR family transcriptional regulator
VRENPDFEKLDVRYPNRHTVCTVYTQKIQPTQTESLTSQAYQQVRAAIIQGEFEPGAPLFEVHLASQLGMSRTPVREALKVLARDGFVEVVPTRGYVVPRRSIDDMRELFELRESLEGMAARFAAMRATDQDLKELERLCINYAREQDWAKWAQIGTSFHDLLLVAARNGRLTAMLDSLNGQIVHSRRTVLQGNAQRRDAAIREHRAILEAVKAQQPDEAEARAREHVRLSYEATVFSYQRQPVTAR